MLTTTTPKYLSIGEFSKLVSVDRQRIYLLTRLKKLKSKALKGVRVIPTSEAKHFRKVLMPSGRVWRMYVKDLKKAFV